MNNIMVLFILICVANTSFGIDRNEEVFKLMARKDVREAISKGTLNMWRWLKDQSSNENAFVGRCIGLAKKARMLMPFLIFLLGIIVTTLKFLTIFSLKSLGIGVLLLIMNVAGWAGKIATWKASSDSGHNHHPPQNIHFHVDKGVSDNYNVHHSGPGDGWYDRISDGIVKADSVAEKLELLKLYQRLGFNVNPSMVSKYR